MFGPFQVAPIVSHGKTIGYGATCKRHQNPGDTRSTVCRTHLDLGKREPLSIDEARLRVKFWCIRGVQLHDDILKSSHPRTTHKEMLPRHLDLTMSEAEMDAFVAALP